MDGVTREARLGDFDAVLRLYGQFRPDDAPPPAAITRSAYEAILASPHLDLLVLDVNGELLATTYLNVIPNLTRLASPYAVIENVVVDARHRGHGLGKQIMAHTLDRAWKAGCYKAMLMTGSRRESTHAFYGACGLSGNVKTAYVAHPPAP